LKEGRKERTWKERTNELGRKEGTNLEGTNERTWKEGRNELGRIGVGAGSV
jgi:hypothetical protein